MKNYGTPVGAAHHCYDAGSISGGQSPPYGEVTISIGRMADQFAFSPANNKFLIKEF